MAIIVGAMLLMLMGSSQAGCEDRAEGSRQDTTKTIEVAGDLQQRQPTPTDLNYSLERYNLIRRAYWVNGQRERARTLPCPIPDPPLGYVVLFTGGGSVVGRFVVEGKVTSLNSYLTPDSEYYERSSGRGTVNNNWLADVDGSYGFNDDGVFFFTPDGRYIEWSGAYLYSDIPFIVDDPIIRHDAAGGAVADDG